MVGYRNTEVTKKKRWGEVMRSEVVKETLVRETGNPD